MDAKSVWPGFDYAHTFDISRGVEYYKNANRVRAIAVYDKKLPGNNRATTFVKVQFLDPKTAEPVEKRAPWDYQYANGIVEDVRARELFMRWDEYEDETTHRNKEQNEREERARILREEQTRIWEEKNRERLAAEEERRAKQEAERIERERAANEEKQRILSGLTVRGIATANVVIHTDTVNIPKDVVKRWLGVA